MIMRITGTGLIAFLFLVVVSWGFLAGVVAYHQLWR